MFLLLREDECDCQVGCESVVGIFTKKRLAEEAIKNQRIDNPLLYNVPVDEVLSLSNLDLERLTCFIPGYRVVIRMGDGNQVVYGVSYGYYSKEEMGLVKNPKEPELYSSLVIAIAESEAEALTLAQLRREALLKKMGELS